MHRQTQDLPGTPLRIAQSAVAMGMAEGGLHVNRHRVMDKSLDSLAAQMVTQTVTIFDRDYIEVISMGAPRSK